MDWGVTEVGCCNGWPSISTMSAVDAAASAHKAIWVTRESEAISADADNVTQIGKRKARSGFGSYFLWPHDFYLL
jgi:hypothetical protein